MPSNKKVSAADVEALHNKIALSMAAAGQRYTGGRRRLIEALRHADRPIGMDSIMDELGDVPQSSAYRSLSVLTSLGITHRIAGINDTGYYELSEDFVGAHHHHAVCQSCGKVSDIESSPKLERALQEAALVAGVSSGYRFDAHRIDLVGLCGDCV